MNCSVIQGSKLSGLLYTLYTNEIPLLHTLMNNDIYTGLTQHTTTTATKIAHSTVNFVNDSTNITSSQQKDDITEYTNKFYTLLEAVYNTNKLKINNDKTKLMVTCKPKHRKDTKTIKITASGHKVKQVNKAKILGYTMLNNLNHDNHISTITSNINHRSFNIRQLTKHTTVQSRKILLKEIVVGKLKLWFTLTMQC